MKTALQHFTAAHWRTVMHILIPALLVALLVAIDASDSSAQPAVGEKIIYVDWNITASGSSTEFYGNTKRTAQRQVTIRGSAVVHEKPGEFLKTVPFDLTVTDDTEFVTTGPCRYVRIRFYITDPARYTGGPDEFWVYPQTFQPRQRADGSWYMEGPFRLAFYINGDLSRNFTYRYESLDEDCSSSEFHIFTQESINYVSAFGLQPHDLEGDATGTVFTRDEKYTVEGDPPLTVNFHATVRLPCGAAAAAARSRQSPNQQVCGCAAYPRSHIFDASDPIVNSLNVEVIHGPALVQPDDTDSIIFGASCEGRRVKNAELEVTVRPEDNSGGHLHDGNRPRGYLNGTEITGSRPSIKVKTNDRGYVIVDFMAGKDLATHSSGIAGIYVIKARSIRFPYSPGSQTSYRFPVLVPGLQELGPGANYQLRPIGGSSHPKVFYGTPATLNVVRQLANAFRQRQEEHNADLRFYGKPEWPIALTTVFAISLEGGGLFDMAESGSWWRPPYGLHRYGKHVDLVFVLPQGFSAPRGAGAWLAREFRRLGEQYGAWYKDGVSPWNLAVNQGAATQATMAPTANGPDLATVVLLSDPADRYVAGAGQTVTYTVGVENLRRGTQAHNVLLTATLPSGLTFLSANPAPTRLDAAGQPVWELGALDAEGAPRLFDVVAEVGAGVAPGAVLTVTAQAGASDADANPSDNRYEAFGLLVQPPGPDLAVRSEIAATAMTVGQPISFTMEVANAGNAPAAGAALTLTLPVSVTLVSATPATSTYSAGHATWNLGSLAPGASRQVTVTAFLDPALAALVLLEPDLETGGVLTYTLQVGSLTPDFDLNNNVEQVVKPVESAGPDLSVSLGVEGADDPGTLSAGQDITYTLLYANFGNQVAPTATLTLSFWSGLNLVSVQPTPSRTATSTTFAGGVLAWDLGDLPIGEWEMLQARLRVAPIASAEGLVLAVIGGSASDIHPVNNVALHRFTVATQSSQVYLPLLLSKTSSE